MRSFLAYRSRTKSRTWMLNLLVLWGVVFGVLFCFSTTKSRKRTRKSQHLNMHHTSEQQFSQIVKLPHQLSPCLRTASLHAGRGKNAATFLSHSHSPLRFFHFLPMAFFRTVVFFSRPATKDVLCCCRGCWFLFFFLTSDAAIMFENTVLVCVGAQLLLLSDTLQAWSNAGNLFSWLNSPPRVDICIFL